jgi:glycosyltransferase involved in cell wall biosynthesis
MRSRAELPDVYEAADVVLFPVRWEEPWGLVPLEAMALGRPVIATGRGGSGEYLRDGENALIMPAQDPAAMADAVRRLASDPELGGRLRAGGAGTAATHTETIFNAAVLEALTVASSHR